MNARVKLKGKAHIHLTHQSCGHYSLFKDEIIDKIYDNCVRNISEEKFLLQNGVPFHVLKDYMANKASDEVISKIQNFLNTYSLEREDFISEFDGFKIQAHWHKNQLFYIIIKSPCVIDNALRYPSSNKHNMALLGKKNKGRLKAYSVPLDWFI